LPTSTDVTGLDGLYGNADIPPPALEECTGNFPSAICDQDLAGDPLQAILEPSSDLLFADGLAGLWVSRRRSRFFAAPMWAVG
jgi:hypothetical protein